MTELFKKPKKQQQDPLPYLERIDELKKVDIIRLKGLITRDMIPIIEARIQENRRAGSRPDKNVIVDFSKVMDVDSATIAFHISHYKEYHEKGFEVGFINLNAEMKALVEIFKEAGTFKIFATEAEAVQALNR